MTGRTVWRVLALVAVVGVAGCTAASHGGSAATPNATRSMSETSSGVTPTSRGSAVAVPQAARAHTQAGAEAFARFYYEAVGIAFTRANADALDGLAAPSCLPCGAFAAKASALAGTGRHAERSAFEIALVHTYSFVGTSAVVDVAGRELAVRVLDAHGIAVETTKPGVATFRTHLSATSAGWKVMTIEVL